MVLGITKDSKLVQPGYAYFCFVGEKYDGHDFIDDAFSNGAEVVYGTKDLDYDNYFKVDNINDKFVEVGYEVFNLKDHKMKLLGITGTDGKTSTALIINKILNKLNSCAYLGTSGFIIKDKLHDYNGMTTPFADELYSNLDLANKEVENFVMEVSSHALAQNRLGNINYDVVIATNLSHEHLDYHKTFEKYYFSKIKLLNKIKNDGKIIINLDDEYFKTLKLDDRFVTIGKDDNATYRFYDIVCNIDSTSFKLEYNNNTYNIKSPLLAEFNVYNLVSAIAAINVLGNQIKDIIDCINGLTVDGRMEVFNVENKPLVIADFAHTPDSIEKILKFVYEFKLDDMNIYVINGSAGERDYEKRPIIGNILDKYSDNIILTEDDPRSELVSDINNMLKEGISNTSVIEIENRKEAIKYAINNASNNDIIIILGKSGQNYMYYDDYKEKYIEQEVIKDILGDNNERN